MENYLTGYPASGLTLLPYCKVYLLGILNELLVHLGIVPLDVPGVHVEEGVERDGNLMETLLVVRLARVQTLELLVVSNLETNS